MRPNDGIGRHAALKKLCCDACEIVAHFGYQRLLIPKIKKDCHMGNLKILYCALGWQNPLPFYILANYRDKNYSSRRVFTSKILLLFC